MWVPGAILAASYLLGAIPFGFLLARREGIGDIRRHGSGNTGATNVLRTVGLLPALMVLLLDAAKGALPVAVMGRAGGGWELQAAAGLAAVIGHMYPITIGFRGGRGVATALGLVLALDPVAGAFGVGAFLAVVLATRYVSLGSMLGALAAVAVLGVRGLPPDALMLVSLAAAAIIWRHAPNIRRLMAGTEHKFGQPGPPAA